MTRNFGNRLIHGARKSIWHDEAHVIILRIVALVSAGIFASKVLAQELADLSHTLTTLKWW